MSRKAPGFSHGVTYGVSFPRDNSVCHRFHKRAASAGGLQESSRADRAVPVRGRAVPTSASGLTPSPGRSRSSSAGSKRPRVDRARPADFRQVIRRELIAKGLLEPSRPVIPHRSLSVSPQAARAAIGLHNGRLQREPRASPRAGEFTVEVHCYARSATPYASARGCEARPGRDGQAGAFLRWGKERADVAHHALLERECDREPATRTRVANPPASAIAAGT